MSELKKVLRFHTFFHPYSGDFITCLNEKGIPGLMGADTDATSFPDDQGKDFKTLGPDPDDDLVATPHPKINIDFGEFNKKDNSYEYGAYSLYNWEVFFHTPLFIATRLSRNGKFAEAMEWFHYIFDPTTDEMDIKDHPNSRYWKVAPFKITPAENIEEFFRNLKANKEDPQIQEWRENPFKAHLVARHRPLAYMKNVTMRYLENLIAWGDDLFRRDTIESLNQATQIYIIAAHVLGPRPQFVPKRGDTKAETYSSLKSRLDDFSNALVQMENIFPYSSAISQPTTTFNGSLLGIGSTLYFCIPQNDQLIKYWDTVADRLFKIRHCMNIEGVERKLSLFEPPIDPGLLAKAAAQGISIASVLGDLDSPAPYYRFTYLLQKATEFCSEVKSLGGALLSALEKRDAEELGRLRAANESKMLEMIKEVKERQVLEAKANKLGLEKNRETSKKRMQHYLGLLGIEELVIPDALQLTEQLSSDTQLPADTIIEDVIPDVDVTLVDSDEAGVKLIPKEKEDLDLSEKAIKNQVSSSALEGLAGLLNLVPTLAADVKPFGLGAGINFGGPHLGASISAAGKVFQILGSVQSYQAGRAVKMASFIRREQEWTLQANMAAREIIQMDKQLTAADIRIQIAKKELVNHNQQIEHAQQIDLFLKGETVNGYAKKFTTTELYQWMKEQIFAIYKQTYQLAYDMAKKAEKAYRFEIGQTDTNFIQYGYWNSAYEGLTAGEKLHYSLRQMEKSYLEANRRELELTKHISLAMLSPDALVQLKQTGSCVIDLPEELFDLDYPGHYFRRIKSASITIPCVTGPYTTVNCTLRLLKNALRINTLPGNSGYERNNDEGVPVDDLRFVEQYIPFKTIATSSAQNDSGAFELNFRDERYLAFEGAGVISQWKLELNGKHVINRAIKDFSQFDYDSISDIILHLRYTAREEGGLFREDAVLHIENYLKKYIATAPDPLLRIFDLKRDFPTEWHKFLHPTGTTIGNTFAFEVKPEIFPFMIRNRHIRINQIAVLAKCTSGSYQVVIALPTTPTTTKIILLSHSQSERFGGLYSGEKGDIAYSIDYSPNSTTAVPETWNITMTKGGGLVTSQDVEDINVILGYQVSS